MCMCMWMLVHVHDLMGGKALMTVTHGLLLHSFSLCSNPLMPFIFYGGSLMMLWS